MRYGKYHRFWRIFKNDKPVFILALDHGVNYGNIPELENIEDIIKAAVNKADALILNPGMIETLDPKLLRNFEIFYKMNDITKYFPNQYEMAKYGSVEDALSYDVAGISFELYIGGSQEYHQLVELGEVIREAKKYDIPIMAHIYPQDDIKDPARISHCIRLGWEIGADIVKTYYYEGMENQLSNTKIPVIIAGGSKLNSPEDVIELARKSLKAGAKGLAFGRNLWGFGIEKLKYLSTEIRKIIDGLNIINEKEY